MDRVWEVVGMAEKEIPEKVLGFRCITAPTLPEAVLLLCSAANTQQMIHRMQPLLLSL